MSAATSLSLRPKKILPYGEKAARFASTRPEEDAFITILEGSVRSSKTWTMIPKFIQLCRYEVEGHRVITGVSKQTVYNNILDDLMEVVGSRHCTYNRQSGDLTLLGRKWLCVGAGDESAEKRIRGLTVGVAVCDELVLQPPSFVKMLLNRMSPKGARFYATTNPGTPFEWCFTDLIQNEELRKHGQLKSLHFTLDDNPNLTEIYKANLKRLYTGVFFQRYVLGLWVVAEGSIYKDCYNEDALTYTDDDEQKPSRNTGEGYISVDCGVDHPQVYLDVVDDGKILWFHREYYWDSNDPEMARQKTDGQYADDLQEFMKPCPNSQVIIPPECASFEAELVLRGLWLTTADNEVMEGIKLVSSLMNLKLIRVRVNPQCRKGKCICGTQCCARLYKEIPSYAWDPKAKLRGEEKPLKVNDHCVDSMRYAAKTKIPLWRLANA
jgi:PBSX family phage terminase large subunit